MSFLDGYARRLGVIEYLGTWNAELNEPQLSSGLGQRNGYYIVSVSGSTNLDGITDWEPGDWAIFNGTKWEQVDNQRASKSIDGGTPDESAFDSGNIIDGGEET